MFDLFSEFILALTWRSVLIGALIFVASSFQPRHRLTDSRKLPADHLSKSRKTDSGPDLILRLMLRRLSAKHSSGSCWFAIGIVLVVARGSGAGLTDNPAGDHVARLPVEIVWNRSC